LTIFSFDEEGVFITQLVALSILKLSFTFVINDTVILLNTFVLSIETEVVSIFVKSNSLLALYVKLNVNEKPGDVFK
jgi:hypothetical protein